jgi:hypothetical protein
MIAGIGDVVASFCGCAGKKLWRLNRAECHSPRLCGRPKAKSNSRLEPGFEPGTSRN